MPLIHYPAIVEHAARGYGVFFPDLPGCTSAGLSVEDALRNAEMALAAHVQLSIEHGEAIPRASELAAIAVDPEVREAVRVLIPIELSATAAHGRGYSRADLDAVSNNPERTAAEIAAARPFDEAFPDLAKKMREARRQKARPNE